MTYQKCALKTNWFFYPKRTARLRPRVIQPPARVEVPRGVTRSADLQVGIPGETPALQSPWVGRGGPWKFG